MTSEAAILGTPAIKCNTFAGKLAIPNELEDKYQLCYAFLPEESDKMLAKIEELISLSDLKKLWNERKERMLSDKIDVTAFYIWFIENYPQSVKTLSENPDFQKQFN
jgi:predicted glycosyltransferase